MSATRAFSQAVGIQQSGDYIKKKSNKVLLDEKYKNALPFRPIMKSENYNIYLSLKKTESSLLSEPDGNELMKFGIWTGNDIMIDYSNANIDAIQDISNTLTASGETILLGDMNVMRFPPPVSKEEPYTWNEASWPGFVVNQNNQLYWNPCKNGLK